MSHSWNAFNHSLNLNHDFFLIVALFIFFCGLHIRGGSWDSKVQKLKPQTRRWWGCFLMILGWLFLVFIYSSTTLELVYNLSLAAGIASLLVGIYMLSGDNLKKLGSQARWGDTFKKLGPQARFWLGWLLIILGLLFPIFIKTIYHIHD